MINNGRYKKGSGHPQWKGGKMLTTGGYWLIYQPNHPFATKLGYVLEHRLAMEEYLGRYLLQEEEVHHLDLNKENNIVGNLMFFASKKEHLSYERNGVPIGKEDKTNRYCLRCDGKTYVNKKTGKEYWHKYQDGFICDICNGRKRYHPHQFGEGKEWNDVRR